MPDAQSTNGKVPENEQPDLTQSMSVQERISSNEPAEVSRIDINQAVVPGADMVINHVDGNQEVARGNVAQAVTAAELEKGAPVATSKVKAGESQENPRTPDPETNGPDQQAAVGKTADDVVAASNESAEEPAEQAEAPAEAPVESGEADK